MRTLKNTEDCPAGLMAREASKLIRLRAMYDRSSPRDFEALSRRLAAIEEAVSHLPATSRDGLLFQTLVAFADVEDTEDRAARPRRLLVSLADGLRRPTTSRLVDYYMTREFPLDRLKPS